MVANINNATTTFLGDIRIPNTKFHLKLLQILYTLGLIRGILYNKEYIKVYLKAGVIKRIQGISRPGRVLYCNYATLAKLNGLYILSTNMGLLTLDEALQYGRGGMLICKII